MSMTTDHPIAEAPADDPGGRPGGLVGWITTTDHKRIGILYCVTSFAFFLIGGALAGVMRAELAEPGRQLVSQGSYNGLFTIHGTMMIFLFIAPFGIGLGNDLVPLQVGADAGGPPSLRERGIGRPPHRRPPADGREAREQDE